MVIGTPVVTLLIWGWPELRPAACHRQGALYRMSLARGKIQIHSSNYSFYRMRMVLHHRKVKKPQAGPCKVRDCLQLFAGGQASDRWVRRTRLAKTTCPPCAGTRLKAPGAGPPAQRLPAGPLQAWNSGLHKRNFR